MALPADWIVPDWPAPPSVRAVFTTRSGGVSAPPFDSFNLGDHVRDEPLAVETNRERLREVLGSKPVFLTQVHGAQSVLLDDSTPNATEADACVSDQPGVVCTIMVADCLPVLFAHASGKVVAAAHAGWRGLAGGVLESCFDAYADAVVRALPQIDRTEVAGQTWAWLGPCIGPMAFEVGPEVRDSFVGAQPDTNDCFSAANDGSGKYLANLSALARRRLQAVGIGHAEGNDGSAPWCTVTQASKFFSHRRDAARLGSTGRMAACIWIEA